MAKFWTFFITLVGKEDFAYPIYIHKIPNLNCLKVSYYLEKDFFEGILLSKILDMVV